MKVRITRELLTPLVAESLNIAQILTKLGLVPLGGNYKTVHARIAEFGLSTAHFTGRAWNQGERYLHFGKRFSLEETLVENSSYTSTHCLKNRLLTAGLKEPKCELCGNTQWLQKPIALELHHLNGINSDHRLENIQLLCPNCHAQTETYRGKNQSRAKA